MSVYIAGLHFYITYCDVPRLDVLNTANLCPAVSVVGLCYLLTVMYTFVWFGTLVHFWPTVRSGHCYRKSVRPSVTLVDCGQTA